MTVGIETGQYIPARLQLESNIFGVDDICLVFEN